MQRSWREDEDVVVRLDFGVGSKVGEREEDEEDLVGVRGRLKDIWAQQVAAVQQVECVSVT